MITLNEKATKKTIKTHHKIPIGFNISALIKTICKRCNWLVTKSLRLHRFVSRNNMDDDIFIEINKIILDKTTIKSRRRLKSECLFVRWFHIQLG